MITWIDPVDVTPTADSNWNDVDVSAYVSSGTVGIILRVSSAGPSDLMWGVRKNGSSDSRSDRSIGTPAHAGLTIIGVDSNKLFECFLTAGSTPLVYLVGYLESTDAFFFTNALDKTPGTAGSWQDINLTSQKQGSDVIAGAICELRVATDSAISVAIRANGSTDDRKSKRNKNHFTQIAKVDGSNLLEGYVQTINAAYKIFLTGYFKDTANIVFNTNGSDVSLTSTGSYQDIAIDTLATGAFIEVYGGNAVNYFLRKNGSSEDIYYAERYGASFGVQCDESGTIEGRISNTNIDFFVIAYTTLVSTFSPKVIFF